MPKPKQRARELRRAARALARAHIIDELTDLQHYAAEHLSGDHWQVYLAEVNRFLARARGHADRGKALSESDHSLNARGDLG